MKTHLAAWLLLLLFASALPALAVQDKQETILGVWYVQVGEGDPLPSDMTMKFVFKKNGRLNAIVTEGDGEEIEDQMQYIHEKGKARISIYDVDDEGNVEDEPEVVLGYRFAEGMLVFRYKEDDEEKTMELTRKPEGTARHRELRGIEDEPAAAKDNDILGAWYLQFAEGEALPSEMTMKLVFLKNGRVNAAMSNGEDDAEEEVMQYTHEKEDATLSIYDVDDEGNVAEEPEVVLNYRFVEGMLLFRYTEQGSDDEKTMELTRKPEGTKRHQKLRAGQGDAIGEEPVDEPIEEPIDEPSKTIRGGKDLAKAMQSTTQMRGLLQGSVTYAFGNKAVKEGYPPSIGDLLVGDYVTPAYVLSPWSETTVPTGFDDWADEKKITWANTNAGYVYLLAGKTVSLDAKLIAMFELPLSAKQEQVRLLFDDIHTESLPYAEADALIKKQTGQTLDVWMKTKSPGTGAVPAAAEGKD